MHGMDKFNTFAFVSSVSNISTVAIFNFVTIVTKITIDFEITCLPMLFSCRVSYGC